MHILQVCPRVPYPPHDGGAIAMYETARGLLAAGHRVTMLALNTPKHHQPADALAHLGPQFRLVTVDVDTSLKPHRALRNLLFSNEPYNLERFINGRVFGHLADLLEDQEEEFDTLQFEGTFVAPYLAVLRSPLAEANLARRALPPTVVRAHNLEYTIWERLAAGEANPLKAWYLRLLARRMRKAERYYLSYFDAIAAITPEDANRLRELGCRQPIAVIPAAVELSRFRPDPTTKPKPRTVFVLGSLNWLPNLEGLDWLLANVWPRAHAEMPELELHVAGAHPPPRLTQRPAGQGGVFVHGHVPSAPDFMRQYELMLVPLLSGGGMRVKIVEGMAAGKAILSTTIGAEGVAAQDGHDLLLRDAPDAWLAVLRAYYHGQLPVAALGAQAARTAATTYDTRHVTARFVALYEQLRAARTAPPAAAT